MYNTTGDTAARLISTGSVSEPSLQTRHFRRARIFVSSALVLSLALEALMTPAEVELIASRVVAMLQETKPITGVLVSPEQLAAYLSMSPDWVYRNAARLGARKAGNKLRFSIPEVDSILRLAQPGHSETTSCSTSMGSAAGMPANQRVRRRRRRRTAHTTATPAQTGEPDKG
jgi:hypothetical protein